MGAKKISVEIRFLDHALSTLLENLEHRSLVSITLPKEIKSHALKADMSFTGLLSYYLTMFILSPLGAMAGAAEGAKIGAAFGIYVMQHATAGMHPMMSIVKPLLVSTASSMGIVGWRLFLRRSRWGRSVAACFCLRF